MSDYKDHPLAELFPLMPTAEIEALAADIKEKGLQVDCVLYEGKILDGRNRYRACKIAGVKPTFTTYANKDALGYVISMNLPRRHLTESQRAMIAAQLERTVHGGNRKTDQEANLPLDRAAAAKALKVSPRSVSTAKAVLEAAPEKAKEIAAGTKTVHAAAKEIKAEAAAKAKESAKPVHVKDERDVIIPDGCLKLWNRRDEIAEMAKAISNVRVAIRKAQGDNDPLFRHLNFGSAIASLDQIYGDLVAIRPWCVCPACQGDGCRTCKKNGLLGRFAFKAVVPSELKKKGES
jgi:hypothetical protein